MKNNLNKEMRNEYKKMLPYGAIKEIVEETGLCRNSIYNFLKGKSNNPDIEKAILKKISRIKKEREKLLKEAGLL